MGASDDLLWERVAQRKKGRKKIHGLICGNRNFPTLQSENFINFFWWYWSLNLGFHVRCCTI
jgi:hypothetical protein